MISLLSIVSLAINICLIAVCLAAMYQLGVRLDDIETMKREHVKDIAANRKQAVNASRAVLKGKISEHMIPHMPEFGYLASDARFLGSPIDYIVFDGMSNGLVEKVVIIDVKTGNARLNKNQRQIRNAIKAGNVEFRTIKAGV